VIRLGLERLGYSVLEAATGAEALDQLERRSDPVHLVLLDLVMPGGSGPDTGRLIQRRWPGIRLLPMTGYAEGGLARQDADGLDVEVLLKPFTLDELGRRVRQVLDAP
jgi:CheY-like chemotaxis protein